MNNYLINFSTSKTKRGYSINKKKPRETFFPKDKVAINRLLYENDPLDVLRFPTRVLNTLVMNGYETVGQFYLTPRRNLWKIRNIGPKTLRYFMEVKKSIREHQHGLVLRPQKDTKNKGGLRTKNTIKVYIPYLSEIEKERMLMVKRLYDEYGTLEKVGELLRITRERVRQILEKGQKYKLFTYQLTRDKEFKRVLSKINREHLKNQIQGVKNQFDICSNLGINMKTFQKLVKHYNIDLEGYKQDARYSRYINEYSEMVQVLGYHPSTTVMQRNKEWRSTWEGIIRLWGSIDRFRSEFGIEKPRFAMHPNTIAAWNLAKERRMAQRREKVLNVYNIVEKLGPISCVKISVITGYRRPSVNLYLNELIEDKKVKRIGGSLGIKYMCGSGKI